LLINLVGWRGSFYIIGSTGVIFAILGLILIREPKRGKFDVEMKHENPKFKPKETKKVGAKHLIQNYITGFGEIFRNPCSRWTILAGCMRFWAGNAVGYYTGKYFNIYPDKIVKASNF